MGVEMMMGRGCGGEIRNASTLLRQGPVGDLSDRRLLSRFASRDGEGDAAEAAFAALVERHGAMVLRTCRSILRDGHDAHDAFQATFLVLARRAGSAWSGDSVAAWLHQVARRTALCARSASARRRRHEARVAALAPASSHDPPPDDLGEALHDEIARLPDRFRAAVVLCLLEGYTHDQAARQLDVPVGTLQSRLSRGRARLRSQLARRGLAPSVAPSSLMVPPSWIDLAAHAANRVAAGQLKAGMVSASVLSLAQEVGNAMMTSKLKLIAAAVLGLGLGVSGVVALAQQDAKPDAGARPGDLTPLAERATSSTPAPGGFERIEIRYQRVDGSGRVTFDQEISSKLDNSGTVRIVSDERSGDDRRHNVIQGKSASVVIKAVQANQHFDIKVAAHDGVWSRQPPARSTTVEGETVIDFNPVAKDRKAPAPDGPLKPAPADAGTTPTPGPAPAPAEIGIDQPSRGNPTVLQPGGVDLTPIAPGGAADDANPPPSSATGQAPEGMEWVRETIAPGKTLERLVPIRSVDPRRRTEGDHAFPFTPQGDEYRPTSGADCRMDELERKLDLILQRLDGPQATPK